MLPWVLRAVAAVSVALLGSLLAGAERARAATFTVNSTGDGGDVLLADGICADALGACTLRAAIEQANVTVGADAISFSIGSGPQTITPASLLPTITQPVTIDASTQPGFAGVPIIELSGAAAGADVDGLTIVGGSSTVRGLIINGFDRHGIAISGAGGNTIAGNYVGTDGAGSIAIANSGSGVYVDGSAENVIGGTGSGDRNLLSGNTNGVTIINGATGNNVVGNYIGVDAAGIAALPNAQDGVQISEAPANTIGGVTAAARNILSGNGYGVVIIGPGSTANDVIGNYIGTDATGTVDLGNSWGVSLATTGGNIIGGSATGARNIISGNSSGVRVAATLGGNRIEGNYIGTDPSGTVGVANNYGVFLWLNPTSAVDEIVGNLISRNNYDGITALSASIVGGVLPGEGNTITYNGGRGIHLGSGEGLTVRGNSISSNSDLGINLGSLGVEGNDAGDGDSGGNDLQNYPVITSVSEGAGTTQIAATLNSTPSTAFSVDFYANTVCDPSGYGEGETYIGSASATTNGSGDATISATFTFTLAGRAITATATNPGGSTSEFSPCSGSDSDGDGCSNTEEMGADANLGGDRDPGSPWDFFDVPAPPLTSGNPGGVRNKAVSLADVGAVLFYVGTVDGAGSTANGVDYDTDYNGNATDDGREYDRAPSSIPGKPWRSGPPNGAVSLADVGAALAQVGDVCIAAP